MKPIAFYHLTKKKLSKLADLYGIDDLNKYYELTDYKSEIISQYKGLSQVFAQMAFHAQNSSHYSRTVKFYANHNKLSKLLNNFDPSAFLKAYNLQKITNDNKGDDNKNKIEKAALILHEKLDTALYPESKTKRDNKKTNKTKESKTPPILLTYARTLLYSAIYINQFTDKNEIVEDLKKHYVDEESLIKYFREQVPSGFREALSCDFLKEFDSSFDLPKPDGHIRETLNALGYNYKKDIDYIKKTIELTNEINKSLKNKITVYQLDRMIYLLCSQDFFLDDKKTVKEIYLKECQTLY